MHVDETGISSSYSSSEFSDKTPFPGQEPDQDEDKADKAKHRLDEPSFLKLLTKLREWYSQEWDRQAYNRYQQAIDEDYYDSLQYLEEDALELLERGQAPVVYNECKPTVDWMIGTERRTRIDYSVLPRRKEGNDDAEIKTKLMKYLSDTNKEPYGRSKAFAMAAKSGLGWLEIGVRGDETDEPLFYRSQNWRYMLYDSNGTENDLSDSRYQFRWKYLDEDVALALAPDRRAVIKEAVIDGNNLGFNESEDELWYMGARITEPGQDFSSASASKYRPYDGSAFALSRRNRVKVIECWYRQPITNKKISGGDYDGQYYDEGNSQEVDELVNQGKCSLYDRIEMQIRCAIYTEAGLIWESESPYKHGRFPFVPIWAYRRARDNAPYGPIRAMRDAQDSLNKRASKALWIVSSNRVLMDEGAVDDIEELRDEVSRPDSVVVKKKGTMLEIDRDLALAEEHLMLMDRDKDYIIRGGGVTDENLGRKTNVTSGKGIIAKQDQGGVVTTEIFDNLRYAVQIAGEIELSLIEQFYTQEKVVRLTGERGQSSFVEINTPDPDNPGKKLNDITATQADFMVSEQDYRDSLRQAMYESLFEVVSRLAQISPDIALSLLDLVVEMADVPNRDELVTRIRQISGQRDPDADMTPEEEQAELEKKQLEDLQKQLAIGTARAELDKLISGNDKLDAETLNKKLEAYYAAVQAAGLIAVNPSITPVADDLLASAGYIDATPEDGLTDSATGDPIPQNSSTPAAESPFTGVRDGIETPETD